MMMMMGGELHFLLFFWLNSVGNKFFNCWHQHLISIFMDTNESTWVSVKVKKVKVHTLDIAPLRSESPLQKRSGMARVLKGFHSFTCTPKRSSAIEMSHTCLCLPSRSCYPFTDPGGMVGWVDPGAKLTRLRFESVTSRLQMRCSTITTTSANAFFSEAVSSSTVWVLCKRSSRDTWTRRPE